MTAREAGAPGTPLRELTKSELRAGGVPPELVAAVRAVASRDDLRRLPLEDGVRARLEALLVQRVACARHAGGAGPPALLDQLASLDEAQRAAVAALAAGGTFRVRGVAGAGKTQVLLHAIAARLERRPPASDLFWSFNRALADMARHVVNRLAGPRAQHLTLETFDGWCKRFVGEARPILDDSHARVLALLEEARDQARQATWDPDSRLWRRPVEFWRDELAFVRDQPLLSLADYLAVERLGRGTKLDREHRALVWVAHERYAQLLDAAGVTDWRQVRLAAYRRLRETASCRHEQVFVDEAQDLPPLALKLAALLAGPNVAVALDGAQAIYRRGFRWRDLGLDHARALTFTTCYRTTAAIARAAAPFRAAEEEPLAERVPRDGPRPRVVDLRGDADEATWVADDVARRLAEGATPGHVAVLAFTRKATEAVAQALERRGLRVSRSADALDFSDETVKVATVNAAKGLEFPIVYLAPLWDSAFLPDARGQDPDEHRLETERRRKVLYVAMTRARDELVLVHRHGRAARTLSALPGDGVERVIVRDSPD